MTGTGAVAAASVKLPSPAPATVPGLPQRTRLAQQQSHRASPARGRQAQPEPPPGPDEDAEGEDDVEEGNGDEDEDNEDKTLYCFCQKMSYGEVRCLRVLSRFSAWLNEFFFSQDGRVRQHRLRVSMGEYHPCRILSSSSCANVTTVSFTSRVSTSSHHCRRCGTVLTASQREWLAAQWTMPDQNAQRSARDSVLLLAMLYWDGHSLELTAFAVKPAHPFRTLVKHVFFFNS